VLYANENIWLPQKWIAQLFDVDRSVVTRHPKNIFSENEYSKIQYVQVMHILPKMAEWGSEGKLISIVILYD
jgi:hypothetical protein